MTTQEPLILAIDTSFDETAIALTAGRRVLVSRIYSQIDAHREWGGVVPSIAKRAHQERFDSVLAAVIRAYTKRYGTAFDPKDPRTSLAGIVSAVAVTKGPGLAIALEVGLLHAQDLAAYWNVPIVAVNHMEGHLVSAFVQNSNGNPQRTAAFPLLGMLVSGAHTELVEWRGFGDQTIIGETVDDAAGEALDKAARMLGYGYPGGAVIERLAEEVENADPYRFPRPMIRSGDLQFSFSGLKTALLYTVKPMDEQQQIEQARLLASSFQEAVIDVLVAKLELAIKKTGICSVAVGGGVFANKRLRKKVRACVARHGGTMYAPAASYLYVDNAAMIGVAAYSHFLNKEYASGAELDRAPRMRL